MRAKRAKKSTPGRPRRPGRRLRNLAVLLALLGVLTWRFEQNLAQVVLTLSSARARALAVVALNQAADEVIRQGVTYDQLMHVTLDSSGQVRLIQANTQQMNLLASRISTQAQQQLEAIESQSVLVPLGSAFGLTLFAGAGPNIRVSILPVGSVSASLDTEFQSAGINQTRHKVILRLECTVRLVIPTGAKTVEAVTEVAVAESIIVGEVPDSFVDVNNDSDMLNLIP